MSGKIQRITVGKRKVEQNGKIAEDVRYLITSLDTVPTFAEVVRQHRGAEDSLHRCLDMTFHKDHSRIRKDRSVEDMAVVRHMALDILKNHPSTISLARKRRRCACDDAAFFADVMDSVHAQTL